MSQNEIGSVAAEAMGTYLESDNCTLERLILKNADVDDFEGAAFITSLMKNKSVKEIDLSNNKLGTLTYSLTYSLIYSLIYSLRCSRKFKYCNA